jgi:hypothetical protein
MSKRLLYDDEQSNRQFRLDMEEKRKALTSLGGHKKNCVGNAQPSTSQFAVLGDDRVSTFVYFFRFFL